MFVFTIKSNSKKWLKNLQITTLEDAWDKSDSSVQTFQLSAVRFSTAQLQRSARLSELLLTDQQRKQFGHLAAKVRNFRESKLAKTRGDTP